MNGHDQHGYRVADLGVIAPLDATTDEVLGIIAATASRERSLGRLLTRSERLLVLVDVCGEVECPAIRSRVSVDVLEVVALGRMGQLDARRLYAFEAIAAARSAGAVVVYDYPRAVSHLGFAVLDGLDVDLQVHG